MNLSNFRRERGMCRICYTVTGEDDFETSSNLLEAAGKYTVTYILGSVQLIIISSEIRAKKLKIILSM